MTQNNQLPKTNIAAMVAISSLFFIWGLITVMNDILIPYLKGVFELSYFQAMMVQFSFFGAYFIGGLLYFIISVRFGDPINKIGYKNGILFGLLLSALGTGLFYPAAQFKVYGFFLSALFILGLGFTMLQIAANPYVAILGPESSASSRLNLSQGFNAFGTTIGPIIGGFLVFEYFSHTSAGSATSVVVPYLILTGVLLLIAVIIRLVKLPDFTNKETYSDHWGVLKFPHLRLGALAIFCYVGAEVAIGSILISFLMEESVMGFTESQASPYVAFYWGGAMIGRFVGSVMLSHLPKRRKMLFVACVGMLAFSIVISAIGIKNGFDWSQIATFFLFLVLNFFAFLLGRMAPARTLFVFSLVPILLLLVTIFSSGSLAMWSLLGIGLFNSIMWSNIFTLSIRGLGSYTGQGSSILVMFILGGAIIPPIQGALADAFGIQNSFGFLILCYLYLAFFGLIGWKIGVKKSVDHVVE